MSFIVPIAGAQMPGEYSHLTFGYTLTPSDDNPSTSDIDVMPGHDITLGASATVTYTGESSVTSPKVVVNLDLALSSGSGTINSVHDSRTIDSITLTKAKNTYSDTSSMAIHVPENTAPGKYVLTAAAYTDLPIVGRKGETKNFVVNVYTNEVPSVTPSPTPVPSQLKTVLTVNTTELINQTSDGSLNVTIPNGAMNMTVSGHVAGGNGTLNNATIVTDYLGSGNGSLNSASASIGLSLTNLSGNVGLNMTIQSKPSDTVGSQFLLSAVNDGLNINDTAYVLVVEKNNLTNGNGTANGITSATITMKVSKEWVDAHGGKDAIKIFRYDEKKSKAEPLNTTWVRNEPGPNGQTIMVFEAISPHGLSIFALMAVTGLPQPMKDAPSQAGIGSDLSFFISMAIANWVYTVIALLIVVLVIVGIVFGVKKLKK